MIKGITKRWMLNTLSVILAIIILIIVTLIVSISYLFRSQIEGDLHSASNELSMVFSGFRADNATEFTGASRDYIENFDKKEQMGVMVLNSSGKVVLTSTGFLPSEKENMTDFDDAKKNTAGFAFWNGRLLSGERAMSETRLIKDEHGNVIGGLRYIVSMEPAQSRIICFSLIVIAVGIGIIAMVVLSGLAFIRSIVKPIRRLSETAAQIAQGDFSATEKIEHKYDDEIGDLCDAVSDMAKDLQTTEQMKNDFISRVSHELRTPLTAIKGWAETMQLGERGTIDRRTFDRGMGVIIKESGRLTGIVEELLDFGRIQSGRMVLMKEKVDILAEFDETVYMLKERAVEEGIHLLYDDPDFLLPPIYGDRNRLKQVIIIVIDNAMKYSEPGGEIYIYTSLENDKLTIGVRDHGCGIPADQLPKVKQKFYKANTSKGGFGIGLAVADEIIRKHNGEFVIDSVEGEGTNVSIILPVARQNSSIEIPPPDRKPSDSSALE